MRFKLIIVASLFLAAAVADDDDEDETNAPTSSPARVTSFVWVDPVTDTDIEALEDGGAYELVGNENIRGEATAATTQVYFWLYSPSGNEDSSKTESHRPFAVFGDYNGDYPSFDGWSDYGTWTLGAYAYNNGFWESETIISFEVLAPPTITPTAYPSLQPTLSMQPTVLPSTQPSRTPTSLPFPVPTKSPIPAPTSTPTSHIPTGMPTSLPTTRPTVTPTTIPTVNPTPLPTTVPIAVPTIAPTINPTSHPTAIPTAQPSDIPSTSPTTLPTLLPTAVPTKTPTNAPTIVPSGAPTFYPTILPTTRPTTTPTGKPTTFPTTTPTAIPTTLPTSTPTSYPTARPTVCPTEGPSATPTSLPTAVPTSVPTATPTSAPTAPPTGLPTNLPTALPTSEPTMNPTGAPMSSPTTVPTSVPTSIPTGIPTTCPTAVPTSVPTIGPTSAPTPSPTTVPSSRPTSTPSGTPTTIPTAIPTSLPTIAPTGAPTSYPTAAPTSVPTILPTSAPTSRPTTVPTSGPTKTPTEFPTSFPTALPTSVPTIIPTSAPTSGPTTVPIAGPTSIPTETPTISPTAVPTSVPTISPTSAPTSGPTTVPTSRPTSIPTETPTISPTAVPTSVPTIDPTSAPTSCPTEFPTTMPTTLPTSTPTPVPTTVPTSVPTIIPSGIPTISPTAVPTKLPTIAPTSAPTAVPTTIPTSIPTTAPTLVPISNPTEAPTTCPTAVPTSVPTITPTGVPSSAPTAAPTSEPTTIPSGVPTACPTAVPTSAPTIVPTSVPTATPTAIPTSSPTSVPTTVPTLSPTSLPTNSPTSVPSSAPTFLPSNMPTSDPTTAPTSVPTSVPSEGPTDYPTVVPTSAPTSSPTSTPTSGPTAVPTSVPTIEPTSTPTFDPTAIPSPIPTAVPTQAPTSLPSTIPTVYPTASPTSAPTNIPTAGPTTWPTTEPTGLPVSVPTRVPTTAPTAVPTSVPTSIPTAVPTPCPIAVPTSVPSADPTSAPSSGPTIVPTSAPTSIPTADPTACPTAIPTSVPTVDPTSKPTSCPTAIPTSVPTIDPTSKPTSCPTAIPTSVPTINPTTEPTSCPTAAPTSVPTIHPTSVPTNCPTAVPTSEPTNSPTSVPTSLPSIMPTSFPTAAPTSAPTTHPTGIPTMFPTIGPTLMPTSSPTTPPTSAPTSVPTRCPTSCPSTAPTALPTVGPTSAPTSSPTIVPTRVPTIVPTSAPTSVPIAAPTSVPTGAPTSTPTFYPTVLPTALPTPLPTTLPTSSPTSMPTSVPTITPSSFPTSGPTGVPTSTPTFAPTSSPTLVPTALPSVYPSSSPTPLPSAVPTALPSSGPTVVPSTIPTPVPSAIPTSLPTTSIPTSCPTAAPTFWPTAIPSTVPSACPSLAPTSSPTKFPTAIPSVLPTSRPTSVPSAVPTETPTSFPTTSVPTACPTLVPTSIPTSAPTIRPTSSPTAEPSSVPSIVPSNIPSAHPSTVPTSMPTITPDSAPTAVPTSTPTSYPSTAPSAIPTKGPSKMPSILPSSQPSHCPSKSPSPWPTSLPSGKPTPFPSVPPTLFPSQTPSTTRPTVTPTFSNGTRAPTLQCPTLVGPPQLIQSRFTDLGASIHIVFDTPTDRGGHAGRTFACSDLLLHSPSSRNRGESCVFLDDYTVEMTCVTKSVIIPGDTLQLLNDTLRTSKSIACASERFSIEANVTVLSALDPIEPIAVLTVPNAVGTNSEIVADATASIGSGGRVLSYDWSIDGLNVTSDFLNLDQANSSLVVPRAALAGVTGSIYISVTVVNFLGHRSATQIAEVVIKATALPSVYILGGGEQTADVWRTMKLVASAEDTDVGNVGKRNGLSYRWSVKANETNFVSASSDPRAFTLPAFSLVPGAIIQAIVNVSNGDAYNYARTQVTVRRGSVVASINGLQGANLAVIANTSVRLDASTSYDQDNTSAILEYVWTCAYYKSIEVLTQESCNGRIALSGNADLLVRPYRVGVFCFELTVSSMSIIPTRNDSAIVCLHASQPRIESPTAIVQSDTRLDKVNPSSRLALKGTIMSPVNGKLSYFWSLPEGVLAKTDLQSTALVSTSVNFADVDAGVELSAPLVLESGALTAGAFYLFALNVENSFGVTSTTISVKCNAAPSSGSVAVSPSIGTSLETLFTITANAWVDDDYPLGYTFYQRAPFNASTRSVVCGASIAPECGGVTSTGNNQVNAIFVDVADIYGATATSDPPAEIYIESNTVIQSVADLSNLTIPRIVSALQEVNIDEVYRMLTAGGEAINSIDSSRRLVSCGNQGHCATTNVAAYRAELLVAFDAVIRIEDDNMETRARQANVLSLLTDGASELGFSAQNLVFTIATDLASRTAMHGLALDVSRTEMRAAMIRSLANLEIVAASTNSSAHVASFLGAVDDTLDALIVGATAGQDAESEAADRDLLVSAAKAPANTILEIATSEDVKAYLSADVFPSSEYSIAVAELASSVFDGPPFDSLVTVRLRTIASEDTSRRRRLAARGDVLLTLPQGLVPVHHQVVSRYNVTAECFVNSTNTVPVPCNGTNATIACNGTAIRYNIECRTVFGPVCAEHNGTAWIPADLNTIVSSNDKNMTCRVSLTSDGATTSRDFSASSNSAIQYYVSAIALTTKPRKLIQHPLLLWTFGVMTALCFGMAAIGGFLDRRDARRMSSRIQPSGEQGGSTRLSLKSIADCSMPRFVVEIRESHIFLYALLCIWRNHSILTVLTRYKPSQPRARRSFLVFFTCLMIMLSQVVALWLAFPTGYCESAESRKDCENRRNLYYEVLKSIVELISQKSGSGSDRACEWIANQAEDESKCQLKVPSVTDIGTKRLLLIFLVFALSLPCIVIVESFYVKYACAPIWLPEWARDRPVILGLLGCLFNVVDPNSIDARRHDQDPFSQAADEDDGDDDDDYAANDDFDGGAPIAAETMSGNKEEDYSKHSLAARHRVGLRLWRNLCILEEAPAVYKPLGIAEYYALRVIVPVMKTIHLMRTELVSIQSSIMDSDVNKAIKFLIRDLDNKWGIMDSNNCADSVLCVKFAEKVYAQLKENIIVAASMEGRIEKLAVGQPLQMCALVVHLMRREHLETSAERQLLDSQLKSDGNFTTSFDWDVSRGNVAPVSLWAKLTGQLLCVCAFVFPIWVMFLVATKLDQTSAGQRTKRIIFVKTLVFLAFNYLTVEPFVLIIMKFALPATLFHRLCFYEDPIPLVVPYQSIRLFVEPSTLLTPIAGLVFAQMCDRVPIRLGPEAVYTALDVVAKTGSDADYSKREQFDEVIRTEFSNMRLQKRKCAVRVSKRKLVSIVLKEAANAFAMFAGKYPLGAEKKASGDSDAVAKFARRESARLAKSFNTKSHPWASSFASDLHKNMQFSAPVSHMLLVFLMSIFLWVPPLIRSIFVREFIVFVSFCLEVWISIKPAAWRHVEKLDHVITGSSEILFLWFSMALIVSILLTVAVFLTSSERRLVLHRAKLRRALRQHLNTSENEDEISAAVTSTSEADKVDANAKSQSQDVEYDLVDSFRRSSSMDSLDGFVSASAAATGNARSSIRASLHFSSSYSGEFDAGAHRQDGEENNRDFDPYVISDISSEACPFTFSIYNGIETEEAEEQADVNAKEKHSKKLVTERFKGQVKKQILFGARELRGAII